MGRTLTDEVRDLAWQLRALGYPPPIAEYRFHPIRRWRFDWCWLPESIAAEFEGGTFVGGRHTSGAGFERDCDKYNAAAVLGYRVLRFTRAMVADGRALETVRAALDGKEKAA